MAAPETPPIFDDVFRASLEDLPVWRRDVHRFRPDPVAEELVLDLLRQAALSPSVDNAQPWRFVLVGDPERRAEIIANFEGANPAIPGLPVMALP